MDQAEVLLEGFGRVRTVAARAVDGLDADALAWRPGPRANSIAWLVWHLARVHDGHLAEVAGVEQEWAAGGWVTRFALPLDPDDTGYGHDAGQVASVRVEGPELLLGYLDAAQARTRDWVRSRTADDLDRVVDRAYDPPVTLGVRLVSVLSDGLQHAGQAGYVRGLLPG